MDFESELKKEFLLEAKEIIEMSEESFLDFEKDPTDLETIDNIFRLFHTLKGSSFTAGFHRLGTFTHKVENLLSGIKNQELSITEELCETLLRSNDILTVWIENLSNDFKYEQDGLEEVEETIMTYIGAPAEPSAPSGPAFAFFDDDEDETPTQESSEANTAAEVVPISNQQESPQARKSNKAVVMIVDDEPEIQELMELYLEDLTVEVVKAGDGKQSLEICKEHMPDIILSDLRMPNMDGLEFVEKIREIDESIPVIFVSGAADREDIISFMSLGAYGFIEKPISRLTLLNMVRNGIYMRKMKEGLSKISMLNFKMHMTCYQLIRAKDEEKRQKHFKEASKILEEISEINNEILSYKSEELAS